MLAEKIPINEVFSADWVTKSGNYFIISSYKADTALFLYEIPSLTFKRSEGAKGNGPDKIQTYATFCHTLADDYLYVRGYSYMSIKKMKIEPDGHFSFIDEYPLKDSEYNCMNIIGDSLLLYYNTEELSIKKYNLNSKKIEKEIELVKDDHHESYYYSNRGLIAANDSFVVYPYVYKKQIDIYDVKNLNLRKRINDSKEYPQVKPGNPDIERQYLNIYAGKKYFYVIYIGHKEENGDYSNRTMEVYDYAGRAIVKYTFDIVPFYYVVDEENGYICR